MKQQYDKYTDEDHQVWSLMYERQMKELPAMATQGFLDGLTLGGFEPDRIPHFEEVNQRLENLTGWHVYAVPGIVPDDQFFTLLNQKKFPATTWIRNMKDLEYIEEPDMFHDVFGHVPLLVNQPYCHFLEAISGIALQRINDPLAVELMSRLYWFTIEFGLIREDNRLKIYGAGLLSSIGETKFSLLSNEPQRAEFDMTEIFDTPYVKEKFQEKYYIIQSFDQLYHSIGDVEHYLAQALEKHAVK